MSTVSFSLCFHSVRHISIELKLMISRHDLLITAQFWASVLQEAKDLNIYKGLPLDPYPDYFVIESSFTQHLMLTTFVSLLDGSIRRADYYSLPIPPSNNSCSGCQVIASLLFQPLCCISPLLAKLRSFPQYYIVSAAEFTYTLH